MSPGPESAKRAFVRHVLNRFGYSLVKDGGRHATVYSDDRWIVSYPRSGNTWLSFLLTTIGRADDPTTFANLEQRCPDIYAHSDGYLRLLARPRLLKSHECFDPRYGSVLYLVRDPRDVAVSLRRFLIKMRVIDESLAHDEFVERFVCGEWEAAYGSWGEHVGSWHGAREHDERFFLLRYEDLHADTVGQLRKVAEFFDLPASVEECERAVALCSPERMRELEREQSDFVAGKGTRTDVPFVGTATTGRGALELTEVQRRMIESRWEAIMRRFGYLVPTAGSPMRAGE
jgi:Sulfotransferase domain